MDTFMIDLMKLKLKILKHLLVYCRFDEWNDSHRPLTGVTIRTRFIARSGILTNVNIPQACLLNLCENSQGGWLNKRCPKDSNPWFRLERTQHILTTNIPSDCH